jgi:hypothetical protein
VLFDRAWQLRAREQVLFDKGWQVRAREQVGAV